MYARGMSVREIQAHLRELYGIDASPDLVSAVTDAVLEEIAEWQNRPLDACYPLVFFDAIRVKIRDEGTVRNKAVYVALGVRPDGTKEILGLWIEQNEGAKFWLRVMNELKNRGVEDILIAIVDGLKGFPEAINAVFPRAHRPDLHRAPDPPLAGFVSWKDRKAVARRCRPSTAPRTPRPAWPRWRPSRRAIGAEISRHRPGWRRAWDRGDPVLRFP